MSQLGTLLHIRANLPNIIILQSVFLKQGMHIGGHCLTCKIGVIAECKNKDDTKSTQYVLEEDRKYKSFFF